ncbi:MAG: branched-chain amino acid ABC transporter permease [Nitrospinota bacterium]
MEQILYQGLVGLGLAMYLWLVAAGLTLIFGVLGVLNFAHGSLYMLGAYLSYSAVARLGVNFWVGLAVGPLVAALVGGFMERFFIRRVYRIDVAYQLLLTFAFILIFADLVKWIWGPIFQSAPVPAILDGAVRIVGRPFPIYNLFVIALGPLVALGLWLMLEKSWWGRTIRAAAAHREMAAAIGVNVPRLFTGVFMFGSWLGAVGGALGIPIRTVSPGMAEDYIIQAFAVAVIGGLGNLKGAFAGAVLIGLVNAYGHLYAPVFELAFMYILMAVILVVRPQGLFGSS